MFFVLVRSNAYNLTTFAVEDGPFDTPQDAQHAAEVLARDDTRAFIVFQGVVAYQLNDESVVREVEIDGLDTPYGM